MRYANVCLKDKSDLSESIKSILPEAITLGAYEKPSFDKSEIEILSVKFSRVGKKTLSDYPNLKWIICRSHGIDNINLTEVNKRGIGVVATYPTANSCAEWIFDKVEQNNGIVIFGNGSISKKLQTKLAEKTYKVVDSKTSWSKIQEYLKDCRTIISTLPLNENTKGYFGTRFFEFIEMPVHFISISRGEVIDNSALIQSCKAEKIIKADLDMISPNQREELISAYPFVKYYKHTSWNYTPISEKEYATNLKAIIDDCLNNTVENPSVDRIEIETDFWFMGDDYD